MQLKSIGVVSNAISEFDKIIKSGTGSNLVFAKALNGLSTEQKISVVTQMAFNESQKIGILCSAGLTKEELAQVASTNALSASQGAATASTSGLSNAMKGLKKSLGDGVKSIGNFIKGHPILALISVVGLGIAAYKKWGNTVENIEKRISESSEAYKDSKSELESLQSELDTTAQKIDELNAKDSLTFTEKEELDNLKAQNAELERSIELQRIKKESALDGKVSKVASGYNKYRKQYSNISDESATINQTKANIKSAEKDIRDASKYYNGDSLVNYIQDKQKQIEQYKTDLTELESEYLDYASKLEDWISSYEEKGIENLTVNEKSVYNQMVSDLDNIYKNVLTDNEYYEMKVDPILSDESLKESADKITEYFKNGGSIEGLENAFSEDIIEALRVACENAGVPFKSFIENLYAQASESSKGLSFAPLVKAPNNAYDAKMNQQSKEKIEYYNSLEDDVKSAINNGEITLSVDDSLEDCKKKVNDWKDNIENNSVAIQFVTDLGDVESSFESLSKVYLDFADGKEIDGSNLSGLKDAFGELPNFDEYIATVTNVKSTTEEVQDAFDRLATSYIDNSGLLDNLTRENADYIASQLKEMGITNSQEFVESRLTAQYGLESQAQQELIGMSNALGNAKYNASNASSTLENASLSDAIALANEASQAGITNSALVALAFAKANSNGIITSDECTALAALAEQAGVASSAFYELAAAKQAAENGKLSGGNAYANDQMMRGKEANAKNTAKLAEYKLKNGKVATSYSGGGASNKTGGGGGGGSKDKTSSKTEINWLERAMTRVGKKLDMFKSKLENLFTVDKKSNNIAEQIKLVKKQMEIATAQADKYNKKAKKYITTTTTDKKTKKKTTKTILKDSDIKKIQNGKYKGKKLSDLISQYGEKKANAIQKYQEWYDKSQEAKQQVEELTTTLRELQEQQYQLYVDDAEANIEKLNAQKDIAIGYSDQNTYLEQQKSYLQQSYEYQIKIAELTKDETKKAQLQAELQKELRDLEKEKFENIKNYYENQVGLLSNQFTSLDNKISEIESSGADVNKSYYESQKTINDSIRDMYDKEKQDLLAQLPYIQQGTDAYYDALDAIQECDNKISDCVKTTHDLNNAINELHFNKFGEVADDISRVITEQEFLQGLFAHEKTINEDTAQFTDAGIAKLGSMTGSYYLAKQKAERDAAEVAELQKMVNTGSLSSDVLGITFNSTDDLQAKLKEMYATWQDDIKETYSLESDMVDIMKDRYQSELDLVQELIDKKKESLTLEKDLHDYQRTIQQKVTDINTLRKQITATKGDTSQEGLAKLQKLQVELAEKQEDLQETEYDRYISDQQDMLDKLYEEYEELITKKLDDFMALFNEAKQISEENQTRISTYLSNVATDAGYTEETKGLFSGIYTSIDTNAKNIVAAIEKINITPTTPETSDGKDTSPSMSAGAGDNISNASETINGGKIQITPIATDFTTPTQQTWTSMDTGINTPQAIQDLAPTLNKQYVEDWIANKLQDTKTKKKNMTSEVNKVITTSYPGKCLSDGNQKLLAKELGVSTDNFKKKNGALYQKLHELNVLGFSRGGVISVDNLEKQVKVNGDSTLISANPGERILTPVQNDLFEKFVDNLPKLNQMTNMLQPIVDMQKMPDIQPVQRDVSNSINAEYNFTLENCTNADDIIRQIQQNSKVQKALRAVTTDQLVGSGRLSVNRIR